MEAIEIYYGELGATLDMCIVIGMILVSIAGLIVAVLLFRIFFEEICTRQSGKVDETYPLSQCPRKGCTTSAVPQTQTTQH